MMKYAKMNDKFKSTGQKNAAKRVKAIRKSSQPKLKRRNKEEVEDGWYGSEDYGSEEEEISYYYYTDETDN